MACLQLRLALSRRCTRALDTGGTGKAATIRAGWIDIAKDMSRAELGFSYSSVQCMCRWKTVLCPDVKKGPWTSEEDAVLRTYVIAHAVDKIKWRDVAALLPGVCHCVRGC